MIDWTKPIETTDGRACRVLATDMKDYSWPVVIAVMNDGVEGVVQCRMDGSSSNCKPFVRNVRTKREGWVNVYFAKRGLPQQINASDIYLNKEDAEAPANRAANPVACVRIEWEE